MKRLYKINNAWYSKGVLDGGHPYTKGREDLPK